MIGCRQFAFHQFKDRLEEALGLPSGQRVNGLDCGHGLNRRICIGRGGAGLSGQFFGCTIGDGLGADPDGQASSLVERAVILMPAADAVRGFFFTL
jgi:hypothetical protein